MFRARFVGCAVAGLMLAGALPGAVAAAGPTAHAKVKDFLVAFAVRFEIGTGVSVKSTVLEHSNCVYGYSFASFTTKSSSEEHVARTNIKETGGCGVPEAHVTWKLTLPGGEVLFRIFPRREPTHRYSMGIECASSSGPYKCVNSAANALLVSSQPGRRPGPPSFTG
jgi:hypothetical protein